MVTGKMSDLQQIIKWKNEMRAAFASIKSDPLNMNKMMDHIAVMSNVVDSLLTDKMMDSNMIHNAHMEALSVAEIPGRTGGSPRPQVHDTRPWKAIGPTIRPGGKVDLNDVPLCDIKMWSDTHFFQEKIIEYTGRPYNDAAHMNAELLKSHNAVVKPTDIVIWAGDVSFAGVTITNELLDQFNGYKILVVGNHDLDRHTGKLKMMNFDEIHTSLYFRDIVVTHHPWKSALPDGMWNVHGHLHNNVLDMERHVNVSVEMVDYVPMPLDQLLRESGYYGRGYP